MKPVWIIGAGGIAEEYAKVLNAQEREFIVIGRGDKSAKFFKDHTGFDVITGGLNDYLSNKPEVVDYAIVATPLGELAHNTLQLIKYGVKNIFCEKPGFLYPSEINEVLVAAKSAQKNVYYAYNRRFFASVNMAQRIINEDGGVRSFSFEFTEWGHVIEKSGNTPDALKNWFYVNSSHVVDLAFFLGGRPKEINCVTSGELSWHTPAIFAGSGISESGALFNYAANWDAPGRWGVEILTSSHRLILRPMEQLQIQNMGSVAISPVVIDDQFDKEFKPGFYLETEAFINGDISKLCSIYEQAQYVEFIYNKIMGK
ncbi:Gfo/Idh/MocA family protein [Bacteroides ovatus]|uniref:Gfo/Idh/MocA family protein n=1 Tax=Bacteroides ovatus TaxID=28116 RepID=UPI00202EE979|nr:Gfo/Idh/MocA family oxidoreductase [Bacteroides ovatus]MCM1719086.1 Gfo/Idh/MocA family oxidoreductase [Bacteroides ovatus]MCM1758838.1 Gfo/Idh/MocA family oxidoreductase [Bacteroides ovatus]MCM1864353.1 Gfo/Idh/MocA family oxidoreductase [Bacteroides ovatus]MCM1912551.1 Gfo/Idh/MocA family oxidoreductase [Bacteroides ovatus]